MKFDGIIDIATGNNFQTKIWSNKKIEWSELVDKLTTEHKTTETFKEYMSFDKAKQLAIKDVGGFVGGFLLNGKRHPQNVMHRQLITLDIDEAIIDLWAEFKLQFNNAAVIHGTHKYTPEAPRYRLIMPISREVSPEEYEAIARRVAGMIGINYFDNTTFQVNRLMFWPSTPKDINFYAEVQDGPWLDADKILATYDDWHNVIEWPTNQKLQAVIADAINKQEDPELKEGIIGAFCKAYPISNAIATFLDELYTPFDATRYTYTRGSTSGGLVVYNDKFAYSHHSTDPICGRLCNAFDLVRIHKFGYLDQNSKASKDSSKKSFKKMEDLIINDIGVKKQILASKTNSAAEDFNDSEWIGLLELDKTGRYVNSASNINTILRNDEYLKDIFAYCSFDGKKYVMRSTPWRDLESRSPLRDVDYAGVRNYIEVVYGIASSAKIDDALQLEMERNVFHPITEYIESVEWDGVPRVANLFIDYFGAKDTPYVREVSTILCTAAVARVFEPGIKYDTVVTIVGTQGTGKSTFFRTLSKNWFSDSFTTFQGKEAFEQLQGVWFLEMAELSALKRTDVEAAKQYISKNEDLFRPAYGRTVEVFPRQCVIVGTTNESDFLQDPTGNRRFLPVDTNMDLATKDIWEDLPDEVDQIWAEAYILYQNGQKLYLSSDADKIARVEQDKHSEIDERRGLVLDYLETKFPENWDSMDIYDRRDFLQDPLASKGKVTKNFVCIAELWCECLGKNKEDMSRYNTRDLNNIMKGLKTWEKHNSTKIFPIYGTQKYFSRKLD